MNSLGSHKKRPPMHREVRNRNIFGNTSQRYHSFLHPSESDESTNVSTRITNVNYIGSYNWTTDLSTATIIVPGSPRQWNESLESSLPCTVPPDRDGNFRDIYDPRMRQTPLLPLILAVEYWYNHFLPLYPDLCPGPAINGEMNSEPAPKFDWSSTDIICNRNSLRHLLTWLQAPNTSDGTRRRSPLFRIDIDLAGTKSLLFNRWDLSASEPLNASSYGFNFEKEFTKDVDDNETGGGRHHRMISYDFGGLKMIVRSEIDAYLRPSESPQFPSPTLVTRIPPPQTNHDLTIHPSSLLLPPPPNSSLLELSTTANPRFNSKAFLSKRYSQLLLSQTPHYYLAHHREGTFSSIRKFNLFESPEMISCGAAFDGELVKLRVLLEEIQDVIKEVFEKSGNIQRTFSLVHLKEELILLKREGGKLLPDEVLALF